MDKGTSRKLMLQYIREATNKGQIIDAAKTADYADGHDALLDSVQKEISLQIKIPAVLQITQNLVPNQLGLMQGFDIKQYLPGKPQILTQIGTKSYYFEMDNIGTATISINGVTSITITNDTKRQFKAYKGNTGATSTDTVTITFGGDYPYNIRNTAMYAYAFPSNEDVQDYAPYVEYDVPEDFYEFDTVINKGDPRVYRNYIAYKWENNKKVILNCYEQGSFDIHYFRYPVTIAKDAPDLTKIELEEKGAMLVPLKLAALVVAEDKESISNKLLTMFESQLANMANATSQETQTVQSVYYMG
jgi:hypothetical protein